MGGSAFSSKAWRVFSDLTVMSSPVQLPENFLENTNLPLQGRDLQGRDLQGLDWSHRNLAGANLTGADLSNTLLVGANLKGACLHNARLVDSDLRGANLDETDLSRADFTRANLGKATLKKCRAVGTLFCNASLNHAHFENANVQASDFYQAKILYTFMENVDAHGASFKEAIITGASLAGSYFDRADFSNAKMRQIRHFSKSTWFEVLLEGWELSHVTALRRHILDEDFIRELQERGRWARFGVWLWWLTSDCGRSFFRWGAWTVLVAVIFAVAYTQVSIDFGEYETIISPLYFSVVTITSLGYGDVLPASSVAQGLVMAESTLGFCLLGGLISILSNKIARRSE